MFIPGLEKFICNFKLADVVRSSIQEVMNGMTDGKDRGEFNGCLYLETLQIGEVHIKRQIASRYVNEWHPVVYE